MFNPILNKIRQLLHARKQRQWMANIKIGNSILRPGFSLRQDIPTTSIRLTIGNGSIIAGSFIYESEKGRIAIGDNCHIGRSLFISRSSILIGNNVTIAWDVLVYDHDSHSLNYLNRRQDTINEFNDLSNGRSFVASKDWSNVNTKPIEIKDDAWIGMGATILKGVTIGKGAIVGARSVVTHDVPDWTLVAGNPAKVIKQLPH